jgi:long-chain acyl-CoA synthetase
MARRYGAQKIGSVGRALPGVALRIAASDTASPTPADEGLLEVRIREGDWLRTNDVARIDEDGFVWILGRADDFILRGGFKIDPRKLERLLESHVDVREAAVIGVTDGRLGSVPVAVLVLNESSATSSQVVSDWVRQHAAPYEVPARLIFTDEIPRNLTQKVDRRALRALIAAAEEQG